MSSYSNGNYTDARSKGRVAMALNIAGLIIGLIVYGLIIFAGMVG